MADAEGPKNELAFRHAHAIRFTMSTVEIIASEVRDLEPKQQSQVLRFLQALRREKEQNEEKAFKDFSLAAAMRGMEDEPDLYSEEALGR